MSRTLTDREKRAIRLGTAGVGIYLVLFFGPGLWKRLRAERADYRDRVVEAGNLREVIQPYQDKVLVAQKLMEGFHMDPMKLTRTSLVAEASAAIQQAAAASGVGVGPVRESPGRPSTREVSAIQFEGSGPIPSVMALLHNLESLGFPLIIDTVQFSADPRQPNAVKVNMTIVVLDFEAWKKEVKPDA